MPTRSLRISQRVINRHPCKSSVKKKAREFFALRRARIPSDSAIRLRACASRLVVPAPAGPNIHLLPQAPKSRRRRLSMCSLPVRNNAKRASRVSPLARAIYCRTWQPAHRMILGFFPLLGRVFQATAFVANSSAGTKSCFLRSTASM